MAKQIQSVQIQRQSKNNVLVNQPKDWHLIGEGRSAFVFKIKQSSRVIKVFFPEFAGLEREEADIYHSLKGLPYFPMLYEFGENYLVMDYIAGKTLYQCLVEGILITDKMIGEVDTALDLARGRGLNPSDIHLRNIILTPEGNIKLIDVVRFRQSKDCLQWDDLKKSYFRYYRRRYFPKRMSPAVLELISKGYKKDLIPFV